MVKYSVMFFRYLFIFLSFFTSNLYSQEKQDLFLEITSSSKRSNLEKEFEIEQLLKEYLAQNDSIQYGYDLPRYAAWLYRTNISKAVSFGQKAVELSESFKPYNRNYHLSNIQNLGLYSRVEGDYLKSTNAYKKLIQLQASEKDIAKAHFFIGKNLRKIGDLHSAKEHLDKAILLFNKQKQYRYQLRAHLELASIHQRILKKENIKLGIQNLNAADTLRSLIEFTLFQEYTINQKLGNLYNSDKEYNPSICLGYYKNALSIAIENERPSWVSTTYNNIGNIYHKIDIDSALYYFRKSQSISKNKRSSNARTLYNIGLCFLYENNLKNAIQAFETALDTLNISRSNNDIPSFIESTIKADDKNNLLYILKKNGLAHLKACENKNQDSITKSFLRKSLLHFEYADLLVDQIRLESSGKQSKLFWREQSFDLYTNAVKTCLLLNQPEKAYYFMEKNKALLLLEDVNNEQLKRMANISDSIVEKEFLLKRKIAKAQNLLNKASETSIDSLKIHLFDQKENYRQFIDSLQTDHPQYSSSKQATDILSLEETQKQAGVHNTSFIQYILDDEQGLGLLINENNIELFEIENIENLKKNISTFSNLITSPFTSKKEREEYKIISNNLYNALIPEHIRSHLTKKVIIIPDYNLHNIPFEALLTEKNQYLVEEKEISYAYSISFLYENNQLIRTPQKEFLGFVPVTYSDNLSTLPNSKTEVYQAANGFDSTILSQDKASKQNLIDQLTDYEVIHLSTHANANDSITPWIASAQEKITLNDIYATKNNAELVVLSACNTSIGTVEKGEGVMSLARGFFNTGANSVVSTLWKADDQSTLELTTDFYHYLKKGTSKSEALRKAKLNYLKKHSLSEASPYYWSSLILIGNPDPLPSVSGFNIWIFLIGFLLFLGLILFTYKKFRK